MTLSPKPVFCQSVFRYVRLRRHPVYDLPGNDNHRTWLQKTSFTEEPALACVHLPCVRGRRLVDGLDGEDTSLSAQTGNDMLSSFVARVMLALVVWLRGALCPAGAFTIATWNAEQASVESIAPARGNTGQVGRCVACERRRRASRCARVAGDHLLRGGRAHCASAWLLKRDPGGHRIPAMTGRSGRLHSRSRS